MRAPLLWDLKVLLLVVLFVYAFFKFTWAFRHYNYCPDPGRRGAGARPADRGEPAHRRAHRAHRDLDRRATSTAVIRAYYFGLAALSWFIHPWLFVLLTAWVVWVIYRREFRSRLLTTLAAPEEAG